jgi:hypothetical protein
MSLLASRISPLNLSNRLKILLSKRGHKKIKNSNKCHRSGELTILNHPTAAHSQKFRTSRRDLLLCLSGARIFLKKSTTKTSSTMMIKRLRSKERRRPIGSSSKAAVAVAVEVIGKIIEMTETTDSIMDGEGLGTENVFTISYK